MVALVFLVFLVCSVFIAVLDGRLLVLLADVVNHGSVEQLHPYIWDPGSQ